MTEMLTAVTHVVVDALPKEPQEGWWARDVFWVGLGSVASLLLSIITIILVLATRKATAMQEIHNARAIAPFVVAEERGEPPDTPLYLELKNVGPGLAMNVRYSCIRDGEPIPAAGTFGPPIAPNDRFRTDVILLSPDGTYTPLSRLRVRYDDALGNAYITEYPVFDRTERPPRYRVPRLPGAPKPVSWSAELSWPMQHYERVMRYPEESYREQGEHVLDAPPTQY
jgi:hypothetical protein